MSKMKLPEEGFLIVLKKDCPTCQLVAPLVPVLASQSSVVVISQDDPAFPGGVDTVIDDRSLEYSHGLDIEIVPTLIRRVAGRELQRTFGWHRGEWEQITGLRELGLDLPDSQPGCGSLTQEPGMAERLAVRFDNVRFGSRIIEIPDAADALESCYDRDWSDGLPVVPPTPERVLAMLSGTRRTPDEVLGMVLPSNAACTVEKVAVNAVLAGCRPGYLPVVLAAVEAALAPEFGLHSLLAGTGAMGPLVVVNGPIARAIGMNSGANALGQGNRANATIGRALQLVLRNVGEAKPGGIDASVLGNPGKYTFCFAEDESEPTWYPLAVEIGAALNSSSVTLMAGEGVLGLTDQTSRTPESLARNYALSMRACGGAKKAGSNYVLLVVCPQHRKIFVDAGWDKARLRTELQELLIIDSSELVRGAMGIEDGISEQVQGKRLAKFRDNGIHIVCAGGATGSMSAIITGSGEHLLEVIIREIKS